MAAIWDPRTVLDVYPDGCSFTCVGKTQKGLRCKNSFISRNDIIEATSILNRIATIHPRAVSIQDLIELAELTLCPRWHRKPSHSQVGVTSRNWMRSLQMITTVSELSTSRGAREAGVDSRRQGRTQLFSAGDSASSQMRRAPSNPRPRLVLQIEPTSVITPPQSPSPLRSSSVRAQSGEPPSASTPTVTLPSPPRSPSPSRPLPPSQSPSPSPTPSIPSLATDAAHPLQSRTPSETHNQHLNPPPSPVPSSSSSSSRRTCSSHPVRKPITDPCPICMDAFCCPDDAVWCRAQCGQNIHRSCFGEWYRHVELTEATLTCVYWYVQTLTFY
jgi:hypothetical protein